MSFYRNPGAALVFSILSLNTAFAQHDSSIKKDSLKIDKREEAFLDSLKPVISGVIISGNKITKDEIILREMVLRPGSIFTVEQCKQDQQSVYNLGLFTKVDLIPVLQPDKKVLLRVAVQEHWYIFPMPSAGLTDGELRKITVGASIRWQNFRGRNESVSLSFGVGYNPFIRASYSIPWIGEKAHLYTRFSGGYSKDKNRSFNALGMSNGERTIPYGDSNFEYTDYNLRLTVGKYFSKQLSIYTEAGYSFLRVSQYADKRTLSSNGVDKYVLVGLGFNYDSRNIREYTTRGYYVNADFQQYAYINNKDFGRFNLEQRSFIPVNFTRDYFITLASKLYASFAVGSTVPYYNHKILGYGNDVVRGWNRFGFEGEDELTLYNEIRVPLIQPDYLKSEQIPVIRDIKYLNKLSYKYGLYFTVFYDAGAVWNKDDKAEEIKFLNGTGIGLNAILPFGLIGKIEWAFCLAKPTVGQVILGLGAKF